MTTVLNSLNEGLHRAFKTDERVFLLGEDVLDPYGGAFKVTKGLSDAFPKRVLTTPISEAGITGVASGMALRGLLPVVEIMFGDFITLAADQIVNHMAKFRWMYNDQVRVPVVIRTPMGGRRGYGPTHSQSLEKLLLGTPGLTVLAPTHFGDPGVLLEAAILEDDNPVLFIENKLLYLVNLHKSSESTEFDVRQLTGLSTTRYPAYRVRLAGAPEIQISMIAYGHMAELAQQAILRLAYEKEIFTEVVVITQLSPLDLCDIVDPVSLSRNVLVLEEGTRSFGWGAEVVAQLAVSGIPRNVHRLGAFDTPIPASKPLEEEVLPGVEDIIQSCQQMVANL